MCIELECQTNKIIQIRYSNWVEIGGLLLYTVTYSFSHSYNLMATVSHYRLRQ